MVSRISLIDLASVLNDPYSFKILLYLSFLLKLHEKIMKTFLWYYTGLLIITFLFSLKESISFFYIIT